MCTGIRFTDTAGKMFFGRNLDWTVDYGEKVLFTPEGFQRSWAFPNDHGKDGASHNVLGMGITAEGIPLYFDCANDAGLAIGGLNFPGFAEYEPKEVDGKVNIAAYEFPLWVASCFTTVDEVQEALKDVAIIAKPVNSMYPVSLLHWMIADAKRSIVVEYTESGMHVYDDDVDALTNQPEFPWNHENLRNYISLTPDFPAKKSWRGDELVAYGSGSGMRGLPGDYYSPSRFVRASYLNASYPQKESETDNVARLFHTLGGVSMVEGAAKVEAGEFEITLYTGGYYVGTRTYYYNKYNDPAIMSVCMDDCDLKGTEPSFPEPKGWHPQS